MDCVNPHGRKNVPTQRMSGAIFPHFPKLNIRNTHSQKVTPLRINPRRLSPRIKITRATAILSPIENVGESSNHLPSVPRRPPRMKNPVSRPIWKRLWGKNEEAFLYTVQSPRTSHPTTARQLDTDAMSPIVKDVP